MATMSNFQDFNLLNNDMQTMMYPAEKKDDSMALMNGMANAISGTVTGLSNGVANTMNTIPSVMSEQRENFKFQFQEVIGCLNLMESQGIIKINRQEEVYVEEEKAGIKEVAIAVAIIWGLIKLGMLIAL